MLSDGGERPNAYPLPPHAEDFGRPMCGRIARLVFPFVFFFWFCILASQCSGFHTKKKSNFKKSSRISKVLFDSKNVWEYKKMFSILKNVHGFKQCSWFSKLFVNSKNIHDFEKMFMNSKISHEFKKNSEIHKNVRKCQKCFVD